MSRELPAIANLEHLKEQAKDLLRKLQQGDAAALERVRSHVSFSAPASLRLADAQHVIARDYGFASWPKLKEHVEFLALDPAGRLSAAVCASDADKTARLLESHSELKTHINEPMANYGGSGMQALLAAVQRSDWKTIDVLLRAGADINARSRWWAGGIGVLDECAPEMAVFLMERGAVLDAHSAARLGMLDKVQELVTADPHVVDARGTNGQTPLHFASTVEIARYLLEHGADIDARDLQHESTPAQHMLRVIQARHYPRDRQDIARYLVARGCRTDILMAASLGDLELVRRHLDGDPNCIRARVSEVYFPKQDPRSGGTIYIPIFGPQRTPHLVGRSRRPGRQQPCADLHRHQRCLRRRSIHGHHGPGWLHALDAGRHSPQLRSDDARILQITGQRDATADFPAVQQLRHVLHRDLGGPVVRAHQYLLLQLRRDEDVGEP
jgi:hypothetical protein